MTYRKPDQPPLFEVPPAWADEWREMPGYDHDELRSYHSIVMHFRNPNDYRAFADRIGQRLTPKQKSAWYPEAKIGHYADKRYVSASPVGPRYPVYIISKGRAESRLTSKALERIGVPYSIVIEPQEYDAYATVIDPAKILTLPFSNLGQGSIPARNWVWEHAIGTGADRHWILDDNIAGFFRYQHNLKTPVGDATIFRAAEDFVDRYENVAMAGMHYFKFVSRKSGNIPPYYLNTRIYSCILLRNDLPYRWRGRYNEDTDLSLRILKDRWCTVLFNAFLADKTTTMRMKGGNTDQLYQDDGRLLMAESLREQHPDLVTVTTKFGRPQHHVNYKVFRQRLIPRPGVRVRDAFDDYGMTLHVESEGAAG